MEDKGLILIVEDEQDMLLGLRKILSKQGNIVEIADLKCYCMLFLYS